jgi:hypothetical protein
MLDRATEPCIAAVNGAVKMYACHRFSGVPPESEFSFSAHLINPVTGHLVFRVDCNPHPDYFVSEVVLALSSNALRLFLRDLGTFFACL